VTAGGRKPHRYRVVDVFTGVPLEGNPLAVFPDSSPIDAATMQKIARELNLSETVFLLPGTQADAAARARIFTPQTEMVFAGHPTIGAAFVLLDEGIVPNGRDRFLIEEGIGLVPVRVDRGERPMIWLTTPPIQTGRSLDPALCAKALGLGRGDLLDAAPQFLSAGNATVFVSLRSKDAVDRSWLDTGGARLLRAPEDEPFCVFVFTPTAEGAYSRMFAPDYGIAEDPATGSSTGPLAAFMMRHGLAPGTRFVSEQGTKMGRRSLLHVDVRGTDIDVGGQVTALVEATMQL
jgi:trans-2,3-dihydro-3-hydroxyanthranilate isomerase